MGQIATGAAAERPAARSGPPLPVHAVLFDIDGTLLDSTGAYLEIMRRTCQELAWPEPPDDFMRHLMTLRRDPVTVLFGEDADREALMADLRRVARPHFEAHFEQLAKPFDHTVPVLRSLADAGFRLGLVTDSNNRVANLIQSQPGCPPLEVIITQEESGVRKPDPKPLRMALEALGLAPDRVLYIGDNPPDIAASRAAGVHAVGITTGPSTRQDLLAAGPDAVIDALQQLPALLHHHPPSLPARLTAGLGEATGFTTIPWIAAWFAGHLGSEPHPGTVNLALPPPALQSLQRHLGATPAHHILAPRDGFCAAHCWRVALADDDRQAHGLLLRPQIADYPADKVEVILPLPLRERWDLGDDHPLTLHLLPHPTAPRGSH